MNKLACLFILFAIIGSSCEKDKNTDDVYICYDETNPACVNYDPCHNKEEPTADFGIYDKIYNLNSYSYIEEDSNLIGNSIRFKPKYSSFNISHTWYLGNEVINDSTVEREFTNIPRPYNIEVSHVIEFPIDSNCYPNATGKDSISRTFSLASEFSDLETTGEFSLINTITKESFNIKVEVIGIQQNGLNDDTIYSVPVNPDERINQNINKVFGLLTNLKKQNKVYISLLSNSNSVCYIKDIRLKKDEEEKINSQYYFHKKQGSEFVFYEILNSDTINQFNAQKL